MGPQLFEFDLLLFELGSEQKPLSVDQISFMIALIELRQGNGEVGLKAFGAGLRSIGTRSK